MSKTKILDRAKLSAAADNFFDIKVSGLGTARVREPSLDDTVWAEEQGSGNITRASAALAIRVMVNADNERLYSDDELDAFLKEIGATAATSIFEGLAAHEEKLRKDGSPGKR